MTARRTAPPRQERACICRPRIFPAGGAPLPAHVLQRRLAGSGIGPPAGVDPCVLLPLVSLGSASGAGQIAEDGTQCTAGHLLRIVSGGGQSADLPRKAAGAVAVSHNAVSDTPSDADAIKAALLESLLLEVSRDVSAFAVYRVRQAVQPPLTMFWGLRSC